MVDAPRPRIEIVALEDLVEDVKRGRYRIPAFQRQFSWNSKNVVSLFESVLRGLPIGTLFLLEQSAPAETVTIGTLDIEAPANDFALAIIDGQQRIASLVGALDSAHRTTDPRFRIYFDADSDTFNTPGTEPPARTWIPVSYLFDTALLLRWMRENSVWLSETQIMRADQAARALRDYRIPTYITRGDRSGISEVFARINSSGQHLSAADLEHAAHARPRRSDARESLDRLSDVSVEAGFGALRSEMPDQLIRSWQGIDIYDGDLSRLIASGTIDRRIREVRPAFKDTIRFLQGPAGIAHIRLIPHPQILPVLLRFVRLHGAPEGRNATLLRRWLWRGAAVWTNIGEPNRDAVREMMHVLGPGTPVDNAQRLLEIVTPAKIPSLFITLDRTDIEHPAGRINIIGLLSANPRDFESGEPVDVVNMMDHPTPLQTIIAPERAPFGHSLANMVAWQRIDRQTIADALLSASPKIIESHLVDEESRRLLANGAVNEFLHHRADAVFHTIREHAADMAEWGARDGESISDQLRSGVKPR